MEGVLGVRPRLRLLGGFELTLGEEPVALSVPAQRLTAYVAVVHRDRPVGRAAVAERFWPDTSPARATQNLRSVLWRMPRPRGRPVLIGNATTLRLRDDLRVDLWEAEEMVRVLCTGERPEPDVLASIDSLQADLLPDWDDDWLDVERESHRQRRLHALERSAGALCEDGRFGDALEAGLGAVRSEPLRESAHRRVIAVHLAEGNHAEALRQYQGYRRLLAKELGLPPSPEIRRMVAPLLGRPVDGRRSRGAIDGRHPD